MNKNTVVITSMPGAVDNTCQEYSIKTWRYWCDHNNVDLIILDQPLADTFKLKPTWQRWYIWDILEQSELKYNKIALIDIDTMIKWDAPNFFEQTKAPFNACLDNDNVGWVVDSIEGYQPMFPDISLDWTEYFNCGVVVMEQEAKGICKEITKFRETNSSAIVNLQQTISKGTDQTPVNYIVKKHKALHLLSKKWNLTHLNRKELLNNFKFIKHGYIWHFNGFDKAARTPLMKQTWEHICKYYE